MSISINSTLHYHPETRFAGVKNRIENFFAFPLFMPSAHFSQIEGNSNRIAPNGMLPSSPRTYSALIFSTDMAKAVGVSLLFLVAAKATLVVLALLAGFRQYNRSGLRSEALPPANTGAGEAVAPLANQGQHHLPWSAVCQAIREEHGQDRALHLATRYAESTKIFPLLQQFPMTQIGPNLWIGGDPARLLRKNHLNAEGKKGAVEEFLPDGPAPKMAFDAILHCGKPPQVDAHGKPFFAAGTEYRHLFFLSGNQAIQPTDAHLATEFLLPAIEQVLTQIAEGRTVLIQCHGGIARSAPLGAIILSLLSDNKSIIPAYNYIGSLHPPALFAPESRNTIIQNYPAIRNNREIQELVDRITSNIQQIRN